MFYYDQNDVAIMLGDVRQNLKLLPDNLVHMAVTSPPYWDTIDYEMDGQLGQEKDWRDYISNLVDVFFLLHRVLRDDGTLWVNIGDTARDGKPMCIPWEFAMEMRRAGWLLQQEIIWHKTNPNPGAVKGKCMPSHEHIFLFSKTQEYYFDSEAIKETPAYPRRKSDGVTDGDSTPEEREAVAAINAFGLGGGHEGEYKRHKRSVWSMPVARYGGGHFATFPLELPATAIDAGSSESGACSICGLQADRLVSKTRVATRPGKKTKTKMSCKHCEGGGLTAPEVCGGEPIACVHCGGRGEWDIESAVTGKRDTERHVTLTKTTGWSLKCQCNKNAPFGVFALEPAIVMDPFHGAGTTAIAARRLGRRYIGCEINKKYIDDSLTRMAEEGVLGEIDQIHAQEEK